MDNRNADNNIYQFIVGNATNGNIDKDTAVEMIAMLKQNKTAMQDDIAIIGMSARLPGASDVNEYWDNILTGVDSVRRIPDIRRDDVNQYARFKRLDEDKLIYPELGYLDQIDRFDYDFFRVSPKEASLTDPHQRVFMEVALKTLEDAGYGGERLNGSRTGVFLGYGQSPKDLYSRIIYDIDPGLLPIATVGNMQAMAASRISYLLNLKGPTLVVDTACSSALVAVELACQSIKSGQCEMAIAGGIKLNIIPLDDKDLRIGIESSDWRTRAFDDTADGSGVGEGAGAVMLKPLKKAIRDGDHIHAVIKGNAANHDGTTAGITVPNPSSQTEVIRQAWKNAGIDPETLDYIETHGTGTKLGDPIEFKGIEGAFQEHTNKRQFCAISSVKSNIGHTSEAAGIAGMIKLIMALKMKKLPPTMYFQKPHSAIDFADSPLYVNTRLRDWTTDGHPRRGGVSAFGMSGTNCHLVLEEAPTINETITLSVPKHADVWTVSARSKEALVELLQAYDSFLQREDAPESAADVCFTANTGRGAYAHRVALIVDSIDDLRSKLSKVAAAYPDTIDEPWAYYGSHKLARTGSQLQPGELDDKMKRKLDQKAETCLDRWQKSGGTDETALKSLCEAYAAGATVDWTSFYKEDKRRRVPLPTYPLQGQRCWIEYPTEELLEKGMEDGHVYFAPQWVPAEAEGGQTEWHGEKVLLIAGEMNGEANRLASVERFTSELSRICEQEQAELIVAAIGDTYERTEPDRYLVTNTVDDYERLLQEIESGLTHIIYMPLLQAGGDMDSDEAFQHRQDIGAFGLFRLYQALMRKCPEQSMEITLLTECSQYVNGSEPLIRPEHATLYGLGKVMTRAHSHLQVRAIDTDPATDVETLLDEWKHGANHSNYGVSLRAGTRYVEQFAPIEADDMPDDPVPIRDGGVYVITGGTGGIGLEVSRMLAEQANSVTLALINRTPLPERTHWDRIVDAAEDAETVRKIEAIRDLERAGARVQLYQADVADEEQLGTALADIRKRCGAIHGVVHGAGIAIDQLLSEKKEDVMRKVMRPKVWGTWLIDRLTDNDELDFLVLFSSVATIFCGATQSDYVAANAYMDAFTHERNRRGKKTLTVNWTTWKETGLAKSTGMAVDTIFKTLPTAQAIDGLAHMLNKLVPQVLIGTFNFERLGLTLVEQSGVRLSASIQQTVDAYIAQLEQTKTPARKRSQSGGGKVKLTGRDNDAFNEIEKHIATVCRDVLGYSELDIHDNFFELGADSIMLMRIHSELEKTYPGVLTVADMFEHSTIFKLAEYIADQSGQHADSDTPIVLTERAPGEEERDVAVIGISFRLPMAESVEQFWESIRNGLDHGSDIPKSRLQDLEKYIKFKGYPLNAVDYEHGTYLENIDRFDYRFFRMSPKEARLSDPHHRLFLQTAWHAIEDAGYGGDKIYGTNTGVFLGFASAMVYFHRFISQVEPESEGASLVGNTASVASGRVSYLFDLKGPSVIVDTACSSSIAAVHMACKSIRSGESEMAIAGGVRLNMLPVFEKNSPRGIGMESADGKTRAFDHYSDGTGTGEGVAAILLKPLSKAIQDHDHIYAVIKGSASNQDGSSAGLTAPNPGAQEEVIVKAWQDAGVDPETITYIETHGTGTPLGDPIEIQGIQRAFKRFTDKKQFCAVGSAKTNITHLGEAAGIAGVIKAALALKFRELPPNIYFNRPNRSIDFHQSPVYVNTSRRKWEPDGQVRRCGVSGFGMSGTNCHVVMEEAPVTGRTAETDLDADKGPHILTLSAMSETPLAKLIEAYRIHTFGDESAADFRDACYTASTGRGHYAYRIAVIADDPHDLRMKLAEIADTGYAQMQQPWFVYGYHKIVSESKSSKVAGEITEKERLELNRRAGELVEQMHSSEQTDENLLRQLCELYAQGAYVDWESLYEGEDRYRVVLPKYPFEDERCWIEIPEFEEAEAGAVSGGGMYYAGEWVRSDLTASELTVDGSEHDGNAQVPNATNEDGAILIFMDEKGWGETFAAEWEQQGREVVRVHLGSEYLQTGERRYEVNGSEDHFVRLLKDHKRRSFSKIIHLFSICADGEPTAWDAFKQTQVRGVYSLYELTKAVARVGLSGVSDMVIITDYADRVTDREERLHPWNAPLPALGKSVRQELPNLMCRAIDIDDSTRAETIMREMMAPPTLYQVAYREDERYVEIFREARVEEASEQPIEVRDDGVYIITGGTGGMGIETAKYLAARKPVHLALMNRSPLPERAKWDEIIAKNSRTDRKWIDKIKAIREVEAMGATVEYYSVNIADPEQLEPLVDDLRKRYGRINGVVHGAGVGGDGFLYVKDEEVFNEVIHPKVHGTWLLDHLTKQDEPDFFIMFSSMSSRFAVQGQGDYCAANSFLDAYAKFLHMQGKKTLSINWVAWKETGMAVEFGVNADGAFKAIPTAKAMHGMDQALNRNMTNVLIGELNESSDILWELGLVPMKMEPWIEAAVEQSRKRWEAREQAKQRPLAGEITLSGKDGQYSEMEAALAEIYCEVLGFNEIDIYDNFFELGGDSILLGRVHASLEKKYPGKVRLLDLFEYTSIEQLCRFLNEGDTDQETEPDDLIELDPSMLEALEQTASAVGEVPDAEAERLLKEIDDGSISIEQAIDQLAGTGKGKPTDS